MARAPRALQKCRDRSRRTELADQLDIADVDAELERRGGDQHLQLAALQALLGLEPQLLRHAAVVRGDVLVAEQLGQVARGALGHAARVDEDQRRSVREGELGEPRVDLLPHFVRHDRFERRGRHLDREIAGTDVPGIDDRAIVALAAVAFADQKTRDLLDRLLRGRQADARRRLRRQRCQPLERQREMAAALVARQRMDLVDDDRPRRRQHLPARLGAEQHVERLGRRDDDVRRPLAHARALGLRRVAGADQRADLDVRQIERLQLFADTGERQRQVLLDVVGQRLQRRNVDDQRLVGQRRLDAAADQAVDRGEEGGQRLAGPGRRRDQDIAAGLNCRPSPCLRLGRGGKMLVKPAVDSRVKRSGFLHGSKAATAGATTT